MRRTGPAATASVCNGSEFSLGSSGRPDGRQAWMTVDSGQQRAGRARAVAADSGQRTTESGQRQRTDARTRLPVFGRKLDAVIDEIDQGPSSDAKRGQGGLIYCYVGESLVNTIGTGPRRCLSRANLFERTLTVRSKWVKQPLTGVKFHRLKRFALLRRCSQWATHELNGFASGRFRSLPVASGRFRSLKDRRPP